MYISVIGTDKPGMAEVRSANFDAFAEFLRDHPEFPDVKLHHGGPLLAADGETPIGTQLVVEAPSIEAAENFIKASPFGRLDLYAEVHVRPWRWLTGRPD
ncbi:MAG: YciI family protein [Gammaproteobacteria bacterium]|nr:YciI family protein [Gammaproteobacteria bacterium]